MTVLNRKVDTDDDGSGTVGTVRNNSWLQDLQDRIVAAYDRVVGSLDNGSSGTAKTIDWSSGAYQRLTLTGNVTLTFSNAAHGDRLALLTTQGAGPYTITWPATVVWPGGSAPTITTTNGREDLFCFIYDSGLGKYIAASSLNYNA